MNEIWKRFRVGHLEYEVSNFGNLRRIGKTKIIPIRPFIHKRTKPTDLDYLRVYLNGRNILFHRVVYCIFNNVPIKYDGRNLVCHKDDNTMNNRLDNLFMGTQKDNMQDCAKKGRIRHGIVEKNKIGFDDIEEIKKKYKELGSIYKVAPFFNVSYATISRAINGKIWNMSNRKTTTIDLVSQ